MNKHSPELIWSRTIDWNAQKRRRNRFIHWYVFPSATLIVIVALAFSVGEALGLLILLGLFGSLVGTWVLLNNLLYRLNPELLIDCNGNLLVGRNKRPIDLSNLESWYTRTGAIHTSTYVVTSSTTSKATFDTGVLVLRFASSDSAAGNEEQCIQWPFLPDSDLERLREILSKHFHAPWRPDTENQLLT